MATKYRVAVIGSGNWGSAIARIVGSNVLSYEDLFHRHVPLWVYEETLDSGCKLSEVINRERENVKYLPGHKLTDNVVANPDLQSVVDGADILVLVVPHQFLHKVLDQMKSKIKQSSSAVSLIKGLHVDRVANESGDVKLISEYISSQLCNLPVSVLMGANLANEVADGLFCETTVGLSQDTPRELGAVYKKLFQTTNFRVTVVDDAKTVELCGALKNIVACGAGFIDGLGAGNNTKAAIIRLGLMEMIAFAKQFFGPSELSTFFESCGIADLTTTCYGGRNRRVSEAFAKAGGSKAISDLEAEMLQGQKLQGPETAAEVNVMLKSRNLEDRYPLMTAVHKICTQQLPPESFIDALRFHPEHLVDL